MDREFLFAEFRLNPQERCLNRNGHPVRLEKIPFDLLVLMVEHAGDLVSREEITTLLWGSGVFQDRDGSLNTAVRKVRGALRDNSDKPRFIQTVVGNGYRFIAPVEVLDSGRSLESVADQPTDAGRKRVDWWAVTAATLVLAGIALWFVARSRAQRPDFTLIAVLPMEDLTADPTQVYFAEGATEEIIAQLGRAGSSAFGVIAGPSIRRYRGTSPRPQQLASELGAAYVVSGTLRREGPVIRVAAHLLRTRDGVQIWADSFEGSADAALALQQDVAMAVASAVRSELRLASSNSSARARLIDPEAYDLYLRGRFYWNQRNESSLKQAIDYFRASLARVPDYAPAYSAIADSYAALTYGCFLAPTEGFSKSRTALERARSIGRPSAEVLASEGYLKMYFDWDFDGAERSFQEAIAENANYAPAYDWLGVLLTAERKPAAARAALERARRLDPASLPVATDLGFHLHYSGRNREAEGVLREVLRRDPSFGLAHFWMGRVLDAEGDCNGAISELASAPSTLAQWQPMIAARGYVAGTCGHAEQARAELDRFDEIGKKTFVTSYGVALIYAGLGQKDQALLWLRKAVEERSHWLVWIRLEPRFDTLRSDPRFEEIVASVFSGQSN